MAEEERVVRRIITLFHNVVKLRNNICFLVKESKKISDKFWKGIAFSEIIDFIGLSCPPPTINPFDNEETNQLTEPTKILQAMIKITKSLFL